jgi:hypothetical protein
MTPRAAIAAEPLKQTVEDDEDLSEDVPGRPSKTPAGDFEKRAVC